MTWPTVLDDKLDPYGVMELPGQQLASAHAASPLAHLLNLNLEATTGCQRLTGIMASMGQSTNSIEVMEKMMEAGMNIAHLNMTFGTREDHIETIKMLREAAKHFSISMGKTYPIAIALHLSGRKIRTGRILDSLGKTIELIDGQVVRVTTDETYRERCSNYTIYVDFLYLAEQLNIGDIILIDNETLELKVEMISSTTLTCRIDRGGILGSYKDIFIPNVVLNMPNYSEKDKLDIQMAIHQQVDIIITSFVSDPDCITDLRRLLGDKGRRIAIMANIQTVAGCCKFEEILQVVNAVMITRQELGSDITPRKLILAQKKMIAQANKANVPICIRAHLLSSMLKNKVALRAELLDVANCVLDGADVLVLGPETAIGMYPVETIKCMNIACKEAEACVWSKGVFSSLIEQMPMPCDQTTATAVAGVLAAQRCMAAAIIVITTSGKSAHSVAQYRPRCSIIGVTRYGIIARQMHLWRGIMPVIYEDFPDSSWLCDVEKRSYVGMKWALERGFVRIGDPIIIISGWRQGSGYTNTMRVVYASQDPITFT